MKRQFQNQTKLTVPSKRIKDIETLAAEAKLKRETTCAAEINALLEKHKCQFTILAQFNGSTLPLDQVIKLPLAFNVISK